MAQSLGIDYTSFLVVFLVRSFTLVNIQRKDTMMTTPSENAARVILVPYPVTVLSSFAYYILQETGGITSPHVFSRYKSLERNQDSTVRDYLFGPSLYEKVLERLKVVEDKDARHRLRRILNFCHTPQRGQKAVLDEIQSEIARIPGSPREVLDICARYWGNVVRRGMDPSRDGLPPFAPRWLGPMESLPRFGWEEFMYIDRPLFEDGKEVGSDTLKVDALRAWLLQGRNLAIGVFGPASTGKSTIVASMTNQCRNLVKNLQNRQGWHDFDLKVDDLDLDLGTPTLSAIRRSEGQNRDAIVKRPWTMEMAFEGVRLLERAKGESNLLFVDLPGKIDGITELLGSQLDGAILAIPAGDSENAHEATWGRFLNETLAIRRLGVFFNVGEGEKSQVRPHQHHRTARGEVTGFKRTIKAHDPFVIYLNQLLVYDLLPRIVEKRYEARAKLISQLENV